MNSSLERQKERDLRFLRKTVLIITAAGLAAIAACYLYLTLNPRFVLSFPTCGMNRLLHIYCPGCGGTRALKALLQGKFLTSLRANPLVLWGSLLALLQYLRAIRALILRDPYACPIRSWSWISIIAIALALFILRNILLIFFGIDYLGDNRAFWEGRFF